MAKRFIHGIIVCCFMVLAVASHGQGYGILDEDVCWTTPSAVDSALVRLVLVSTSSTDIRILSHINAQGNPVNVTGGYIRYGRCGCCNNAPGMIANTPTVQIVSLSVATSNPFFPEVCNSTLIANTTYVTDSTQVTVTRDGVPVTFSFDPMSGQITKVFNDTVGSGSHTIVVSVTTPYGSDSDSGNYSCGT